MERRAERSSRPNEQDKWDVTHVEAVAMAAEDIEVAALDAVEEAVVADAVGEAALMTRPTHLSIVMSVKQIQIIVPMTALMGMEMVTAPPSRVIVINLCNRHTTKSYLCERSVPFVLGYAPKADRSNGSE